MLLANTEFQHKKIKSNIFSKIRIVTVFFISTILLPVIIYFLFNFGLITGKPAFNSEIQEPVAKVMTSSGVGTAFLISSKFLLTARHVVENNKVGDQIDLIFEQSKNKYQTKGKIKFIALANSQMVDGLVPLEYFLNDVAVIEVDEIRDIEPLTLGESDVVSNLDEVILIGYPNGDYSISKGNINNTKFQGIDLFKLDATANQGNSGGPCILKDDNCVIGILVGGSGPFVQGENVAVKIDNVKRILQQAGVVF